MTDLELLSEYQAWRDDHEGLDRDVTPLAFQAYRRALDNEDKLDRIMRLQLRDAITDNGHLSDDLYADVLQEAIQNVLNIIGQETEHE